MVIQTTPRFLNEQEYEQMQKQNAKAIVAGQSTEAVAAIGAAVLTILGLTGILPFMMAAVSVIILGAGLFIESLAVAPVVPKIQPETNQGKQEQYALSGGLTVEGLCGISAVALGILALLGVVPGILISSAVIALGAAAMFAPIENQPLSHFNVQKTGNSGSVMMMNQSFLASSGLESIAGIAAVVLGILALTGVYPLIMNLSAILAVSATALLSSSAFAAKLGTMLYHRNR